MKNILIEKKTLLIHKTVVSAIIDEVYVFPK